MHISTRKKSEKIFIYPIDAHKKICYTMGTSAKVSHNVDYIKLTKRR